MNKLKQLLAISLCVIGLSMSACGQIDKASSTQDNQKKLFDRVEVDRVIDGDTILIRSGPKQDKERVRLIGIDTPETKHPKKPIEFYGEEATAFTRSLLDGKTVYLEKDISDRDRYQRLLRYVWLEEPTTASPAEKEFRNLCVNAILLENGFARIATFPPDVRYTNQFLKLEKEARDKKIGLWQKERKPSQMKSLVDGITSEKAASAKDVDSSTANKKIKGNRMSKLYHMPGSRYYDTVKDSNAIYFDSVKEAEQAGYRPAKN